MLTLRPYQEHAKLAVYDHLRRRSDNPCVVLPTASGKTPVIASICKDAVMQWQGRVIILAHVKELLEQAVDKLAQTCPEVKFGVYSAGLNRRDTFHPVIVAGIQSVYQRACELDRFDLVIVDEAHLIPQDGDGMYRKFLADAKVINPDLRICGFTATPFRLKSGLICTPDGYLNEICFEVGIRELIRDGYLCPPVSKAGKAVADTSEIHVRGGEFVSDELELAMDQDSLVVAACQEIIEQTRARRACLIFATGIKHGNHIAHTLRERHGIECGFVSNGTSPKDRATLLRRFRDGDLKYLCNVNVLTTGFDAPNIDSVALLRPTMSPGLYYQMVGRGFRLHPEKTDCLVLDFGGNVLRHGPVDLLQATKPPAGTGEAPAKQCPDCDALIATGYARCPECGHVFPPREFQKHDPNASAASVLSEPVKDTQYTVRDTRYSVHKSRKAADDAPRSMRVEYQVGWQQYKSEWICFEHTGYPRAKAVQWWRQRSPDPVPANADDAVMLAREGALAPTQSITVRQDPKEDYERIVGYELGAMPEAVTAGDTITDDEIPF